MYRRLVCLHVIELMNKNTDIMKDCYKNFLKIMHLFPPAKNENKFIYGKLIEM